MSGEHQTVMCREAVEILTRGGTSGGLFLDATLGGGGHSEALLRSRDDVKVIGIDQDAEGLAAASARLAPFGARFRSCHGNFRELDAALGGRRPDGILMDLGVSSRHLDMAERGFSFQRDGPLDMRMDAEGALTAADVVNGWKEEELARIFWELGGEGRSRRIARAIVAERESHPIRTTVELASIVVRALGGGRGWQRIHPATRVFQAIRMTVNDELGALREGLERAWEGLAARGRLVVISFHSLEDREVKHRFREWARDKERVELITRKPMTPEDEETRRNPRARSAKLRAIERGTG